MSSASVNFWVFPLINNSQEALPLFELVSPSVESVESDCISSVAPSESSVTWSNFLSSKAYLLYQALHIKKINTSSYHPQTNALTERFNLTFCEMCSQYVNRHHTDWDEHIPYLLFAYNTSVHPTTKRTPFWLTYGRDPILPIDIALRTSSQRPQYNINAYSKMLAERLTEAANLVRQSVMKQNQQSKRRWDAHIRPRSFTPGDRVWVFMPDLLKVRNIRPRLPNQLKRQQFVDQKS